MLYVLIFIITSNLLLWTAFHASDEGELRMRKAIIFIQKLLTKFLRLDWFKYRLGRITSTVELFILAQLKDLVQSFNFW